MQRGPPLEHIVQLFGGRRFTGINKASSAWTGSLWPWIDETPYEDLLQICDGPDNSIMSKQRWREVEHLCAITLAAAACRHRGEKSTRYPARERFADPVKNSRKQQVSIGVSLTAGDGACTASCGQATDGLNFIDQLRAKPCGKFRLLTSSQRRKCRTQGPRTSIGKFWQKSLWG